MKKITKRKRFLALALSIMLILSTGVTAFAEEQVNPTTETTAPTEETSTPTEETTTPTEEVTTPTGTTTSTPVKQDTMYILFWSNSFGLDTASWMYDLAKATGRDVCVAVAYIGGCSINKHMRMANSNSAGYAYYYCSSSTKGAWKSKPKMTIKSILQRHKWDVVILGQAPTQLATTTNTTKSNVSAMANYAKKYSAGKNTKIGFLMHWAMPSNYGCYPRRWSNITSMYNSICSVTKNNIATCSQIDYIIPVGTTIQNMRPYFGDKLNRDDRHLNRTVSRLAAAMTTLKVLGFSFADYTEPTAKFVAYQKSHGENPSDADTVAFIKKAVVAAIKKPYAQTSLGTYVPPVMYPTLTKDGSKVTLKWKKAYAARSYSIYVSVNGGSYKKLTTTTKLSYTTSVSKEKVYAYVVYSNYISGTYSNNINKFTPVRTNTLSPITLNSVSSAEGAATLQWKRNTYGTGYLIRYSTNSDMSGYKLKFVQDNTASETVIPELEVGKTYYFQARVYKAASGANNYSAWSAKKSVIIKE